MRLILAFFLGVFSMFSQTITLSDADIKAFPSAEGFGRITTGGRGGQVIRVTNLNDSGPGSFRAAVEQTGPRIVVFDVAGDIMLNTHIIISSTRGDLTIAGETAPSPGITIRGDNVVAPPAYGGLLEINGNNIVIRYISVRNNSQGEPVIDGIRLRRDSGMSNIVFDHVSISHGTDENLSTRGVTNATIQNCMLSNAVGPYTYLFGQDNFNVSFIGNYLSHTRSRNPFLGYGTSGETIEYINNIVYGYEGGMNMVYGNNADVLGNVYKAFIDNTPDFTTVTWDPNQFNNPGGVVTDGSFYVADNFQLNPHQFSLYDNEVLTYNSASRVITNSLISSWEQTAADIEQRVIGGKLPGNSIYQDQMDQQAISDYLGNTGNLGSLTVPSKSPNLSPLYVDSDGDGLSDEYEVANGAGPGNWFVSPSTRPVTAQLVSGVTIDQTAVTAAIRYTHMDIFLGELAGDWTGGSSGGGGTNDPATDKGISGTSAMLIAH